MIPLFDRVDFASDAAFGMWFSVGMVIFGLVIGAYMVARRAWRRGRWVRANRCLARRHARFERQVARVTKRRREQGEQGAYRARIARIVRRLKDADMGRG